MNYIIYIVMVFIEIILNLLQPYFLGKLIVSITNKFINEAMMYVVTILLLKIGEIFIKTISFYITHYIRNKLNKDVRENMYNGTLMNGTYKSITQGQLLERLSEVAIITRKVDEVIIAFTKIIKIIVTCVFIAFISYKLSLVSFILFGLYILSSNKFDKILKDDVLIMKKTKEDFNNTICEIYEKDVNANLEICKMNKVQNDFTDVRIKYNIHYDKLLLITNIIAICSEIILMVISVYLYMSNEINLDGLVAFIAYIATLKVVTREILTFEVDLKQIEVSLMRVNELINI